METISYEELIDLRLSGTVFDRIELYKHSFIVHSKYNSYQVYYSSMTNLCKTL